MKGNYHFGVRRLGAAFTRRSLLRCSPGSGTSSQRRVAASLRSRQAATRKKAVASHRTPRGNRPFSRVEEGRGYSRMKRRPVSLPRSSNRTCGFPASGSPTVFTARLTNEAPDERDEVPAHPSRQTRLRGKTALYLACRSCASAAGNAAPHYRRSCRPLDRPSAAFHS